MEHEHGPPHVPCPRRQLRALPQRDHERGREGRRGRVRRRRPRREARGGARPFARRRGAPRGDRRSRVRGHRDALAMTAVVPEHLDLPIEGMTCASCASRIERRLNKLDGVVASVNYATERASVSYDAARITPGDLVDAIDRVGYTARLPQAAVEPAEEADPTAELRTRLVAAAALSLPVLLMGTIPALQ